MGGAGQGVAHFLKIGCRDARIGNLGQRCFRDQEFQNGFKGFAQDLSPAFIAAGQAGQGFRTDETIIAFQYLAIGDHAPGGGEQAGAHVMTAGQAAHHFARHLAAHDLRAHIQRCDHHGGHGTGIHARLRLHGVDFSDNKLVFITAQIQQTRHQHGKGEDVDRQNAPGQRGNQPAFGVNLRDNGSPRRIRFRSV